MILDIENGVLTLVCVDWLQYIVLTISGARGVSVSLAAIETGGGFEVSVSISADLFRLEMDRMFHCCNSGKRLTMPVGLGSKIQSVWYVLEHASDSDIEPCNLVVFGDGDAMYKFCSFSEADEEVVSANIARCLHKDHYVSFLCL